LGLPSISFCLGWGAGQTPRGHSQQVQLLIGQGIVVVGRPDVDAVVVAHGLQVRLQSTQTSTHTRVEMGIRVRFIEILHLEH
jgi:hypothetical protein